jgi:hypothetical protein
MEQGMEWPKNICLAVTEDSHVKRDSGVPTHFFGAEGVQQIQLRTEGRENGDLGAVAP